MYTSCMYMHTHSHTHEIEERGRERETEGERENLVMEIQQPFVNPRVSVMRLYIETWSTEHCYIEKRL